MRFLLGFLSATIFIAIMIVGCWLYFDFSIDTNNEQEEQNTPVETSTKSLEQNNTQQQPQQPTKQKHNGVTPPNMKENPQDWKKEYDEINEGTDETPYVMIDGKPVDPRHVTGKDN